MGSPVETVAIGEAYRHLSSGEFLATTHNPDVWENTRWVHLQEQTDQYHGTIQATIENDYVKLIDAHGPRAWNHYNAGILCSRGVPFLLGNEITEAAKLVQFHLQKVTLTSAGSVVIGAHIGSIYYGLEWQPEAVVGINFALRKAFLGVRNSAYSYVLCCDYYWYNRVSYTWYESAEMPAMTYGTEAVYELEILGSERYSGAIRLAVKQNGSILTKLSFAKDEDLFLNGKFVTPFMAMWNNYNTNSSEIQIKGVAVR